MSKEKFFEFAREVSMSMAIELALANGVSEEQVTIWAGSA